MNEQKISWIPSIDRSYVIKATMDTLPFNKCENLDPEFIEIVTTNFWELI